MESGKEENDLPNLHGDYPLSMDQIAYYRDNGHVVLREVASETEVMAFRPLIGEVIKERQQQIKPMKERNITGMAFVKGSNLWTIHPAIRRFVLARRFAKIAADLMGVEGVRIYHDQALFKEPGGGYTPWHQDQIYWPLDTENTITLWMPLVPISADIGSMTFASGSHRHGYISKLTISAESHSTLSEYIEGNGLHQITHGAMAPGDVTFHAGWTLHSAPGNPTDTMREVMTVIYFADGARAIEPDSAARRSDFEKFLPGIEPGQLADSALNPLVFSKSGSETPVH